MSHPKMITVCDRCLHASCFQGAVKCDWHDTAGCVDMTWEALCMLRLEGPEWWTKERDEEARAKRAMRSSFHDCLCVNHPEDVAKIVILCCAVDDAVRKLRALGDKYEDEYQGWLEDVKKIADALKEASQEAIPVDEVVSECQQKRELVRVIVTLALGYAEGLEEFCDEDMGDSPLKRLLEATIKYRKLGS